MYGLYWSGKEEAKKEAMKKIREDNEQAEKEIQQLLQLQRKYGKL